MALIGLSYCNAASGLNYSFDYNDTAHIIQNVSEGLSCGPGLPSGIQLYSHVDGNTTYYVKTQNSFPYGSVSSVTAQPCSVTIDSVPIGNASTSQSADGSIIINASGPQAKEYSINDGLTYQVSNTFLGLTPGPYKVSARSQQPANNFCVDTENVTVGFNNVVCNLSLGNITTVKPTAPGGLNGKIIVNTLTNPSALAVEYRIGVGAWQDSTEFAGLSAGNYNVQVRYKLFTSCTDNRNVVLLDGVTCDIVIQQTLLTHEQSKFGNNGAIRIIGATTHGPLQYSIDDGDNYQAADIFNDLSSRIYVVRIKDAENCEDFATVELLPHKSPYIEIPIVNAHRFVITSGPGVDNSVQNFDNTLFSEMGFPAVEPCIYRQLVQQGDNRRIQFRSNYENHTLKVMREDNTQAGFLTLEMVKDFTRQAVSGPVLLANAGANKTQIFFENGLPDWARVGQDITISATGEIDLDKTFEIKQILPGVLDAVGFVVMIIDVIYPAPGLLNGTLAVVYDIEPFDVFESAINWSEFANGNYYLKLEGSDSQFPPFVALSEPIELLTSRKHSVVVKYKCTDNAHKIFYDTGIEFLIRVGDEVNPCEFKWPQPGGSEINHEQSDNKMVKLYENVTRNPQLLLYDIPPYLAEKLALICGHDSVVVNGIQYGKQDEKVEITYIDMDPFCHAKVKLRQNDFVAENSDDQGDVDVPATVLEVNGILLAMNP